VRQLSRLWKYVAQLLGILTAWTPSSGAEGKHGGYELLATLTTLELDDTVQFVALARDRTSR
jgi:hypothetical protein